VTPLWWLDVAALAAFAFGEQRCDRLGGVRSGAPNPTSPLLVWSSVTSEHLADAELLGTADV
jgi:hypothetical protein